MSQISFKLGTDIDNILKMQTEYAKYDTNVIEPPKQNGGAKFTKYIVNNYAIIYATSLMKAAHEAFDIINYEKPINKFILIDKNNKYYFIGNRNIHNNINIDKIMLIDIYSTTI